MHVTRDERLSKVGLSSCNKTAHGVKSSSFSSLGRSVLGKKLPSTINNIMIMSETLMISLVMK